MLTFGSLFAGIGGFDLGFERAGMTCEWQVEIKDYRRRVLAKQWPGIERWDDVRTFPPSWGKWSVDVICGGPPCQRTSVAAAIQGKRTGETLWPEMRRIVEIIKPRIVVVEQPGGNKDWEAQVAADLAGAGYIATRLKRSARDCGAPHHRRRVFFVAYAMRERRQAVAWQAGPSEAGAGTWPAPPRGTWRTSGAGNRGVDDGFSDWLERLEALGDSVCPAVSEWIGRRIVESAARSAERLG